MKRQRIGILAFQGDVAEHIYTTKQAAENLNLEIDAIVARTKESLEDLDALIIPGGESTTLYKLCEREDTWVEMKKIRNIFGTCAGAIMLAKIVHHKVSDQKTLELMDIEIDRNACGRQTDSFEKNIKTSLGDIRAIFIRAPKIKKAGKDVKILARIKGEIVACEQHVGKKYYLAACFHPELSSTLFHEYFIKKVYRF